MARLTVSQAAQRPGQQLRQQRRRAAGQHQRRRRQHKMPDQLAVALGKAGGDVGGGDQPQPLAAAGQRRRQQQIIGPVPGGIAQAGRAVLHGGPLVGKAHPAGHVGVIDGAAGAQHRKPGAGLPRRGPLPGPVAPADPLQGGGIGGAGLLDGGLDGKAVPQMLGGGLLLGRRAQRGKVLLHRPRPAGGQRQAEQQQDDGGQFAGKGHGSSSPASSR